MKPPFQDYMVPSITAVIVKKVLKPGRKLGHWQSKKRWRMARGCVEVSPLRGSGIILWHPNAINMPPRWGYVQCQDENFVIDQGLGYVKTPSPGGAKY
jgi:hypothetical protein